MGVVDDWLDDRRALGRVGSVHTEKAYRSDLRAWAAALGGTGDAPGPDLLTTPQVRDALVGMIGSSDRTRARRVSTLRGFCDFLVSAGQLDRNPVTDDLSVQVPADSDPVRFTPEELERIRFATADPYRRRVKAAPAMEAVMLELLLDGMLRSSELAGLVCRDWDRYARTVRFRGKRSKWRTVPLPETSAARLDRWVRTQHPDPQPGAPLLTRDGTPLTVGIVESIVAGWLTDARVERRPGALVHAFRHTGAVMWLQRGVSVAVLRDMLGHSSIATTSRYLRLSASEVADAIRQVDAPSTSGPGRLDTASLDERLDSFDDPMRVIAERLDRVDDPKLAGALAQLLRDV